MQVCEYVGDASMQLFVPLCNVLSELMVKMKVREV